jgi:hypothetical protein
MELPVHGKAKGIVVDVDRFWGLPEMADHPKVLWLDHDEGGVWPMDRAAIASRPTRESVPAARSQPRSPPHISDSP